MQQLKNIMSINNGRRALLLCAMATLWSCTSGPIDPAAQRMTLGTMNVGIISSIANKTDFQFRGRVTLFDTRDSIYNAPGIGAFRHFVTLRDTLTGDTLRLFYTLPLNQIFRVDTALRALAIYKRIDSRFALILKSKNDSLIAMVGTLLPGELDTIQTKSGVQQMRVAVGPDLYGSRNTDCGREGDFDMVFSTTEKQVSVAPARYGTLTNGDKLYLVVNVANTQLIKDVAGCGPPATQFSYMIIRQ